MSLSTDLSAQPMTFEKQGPLTCGEHMERETLDSNDQSKTNTKKKLYKCQKFLKAFSHSSAFIEYHQMHTGEGRLDSCCEYEMVKH